MRQQRACIASASLEERRLLLEENRLREQREQRKFEEKKLHEQRELEEKKLQQQRELSEQRLAQQAERKTFKLVVMREDGELERFPAIELQRGDWASFQRHTAKGPLFVLSAAGPTKQIINGFDGLVEGHEYMARPDQSLGSRLRTLESSLRNRVCADEEALGEQLFTMLSPCISGLVRVPEARRLYKWREPGQLERFATLVRMAKATSPEERTELMSLKKQFDDADRQQRIVAMEFDAVLLNSQAAVVCEAKSSMTSDQLIDFDSKINRLMVQATKDPVYQVYHGMSVLPVLMANHFLESKEELQSLAREYGILLLTRNGLEYGPRLACNGVSDCDLYRSLLRPKLG